MQQKNARLAMMLVGVTLLFSFISFLIVLARN